MYIEPRDVAPVDFPRSTATAPEITTLDLPLTFTHGVVWLNVPYARKSGMDLHLQIIWPPVQDWEADGAYPCVVFVQGSGWRAQSLGQWLLPLADFARRGYVVAIVEYRPSIVAPFPAQVADAKSAVRFLRCTASDFRIDPAKLAIWGDSSGGHTALLAAFTPADEFSDDTDAEPLGLSACVDFYGPTDISRMNEEPAIADHLGFDSAEGLLIGGYDLTERPDLVVPTVVANHIPAGRTLPPVLMVHGDKDRVVPFAQSVNLYEALRAAGQPVELYRLTDADHASGAFWQPTVMDVVDQFLQRGFTAAG